MEIANVTLSVEVLADLLKMDPKAASHDDLADRIYRRIDALLDAAAEADKSLEPESSDLVRLRRGDHLRARREGDTVKVTLQHPITHGTETIVELVVHDLTVGDLDAIGAAPKREKIAATLARATKRTPNELRGLRSVDVKTLSAAAAFLQEG